MEIIKEFEKTDKIVCFTKLPYSYRYTSVWDEYNLAITYHKYSLEKDKYKSYIEQKLQEGFNEKIEIFFCGGFSIRKNFDKTKEFNEYWYENILQCGIEDQISLQFVQQKYSDLIYPLEYQKTWKYYYE